MCCYMPRGAYIVALYAFYNMDVPYYRAYSSTSVRKVPAQADRVTFAKVASIFTQPLADAGST